MSTNRYLPGYEAAWKIGRELHLQVAAHILSPFGMRPTFDALATNTGGDSHTLGIGPDNLFVHMTGMSDMAWSRVKAVGARVSIAVPIEMNMRHGMPPLLKTQALGIEPSLSVDVECTMTADMFTQMRSAMTLQRALVNQMILEQGDFSPPNQYPTPAPGTPALLETQDVLRYATMQRPPAGALIRAPPRAVVRPQRPAESQQKAHSAADRAIRRRSGAAAIDCDEVHSFNAVLPLRLVAFGGRKTQTQVGLFFSVAAVVSMFLRPLVGGSGMILPARRSQARVGSSQSSETQRDGTVFEPRRGRCPIHGGRNRNRERTAPLRA
jgi:hypothetical protein